MTGLESIPKISELLKTLIEKVKDRQTGALVQQIQQHQLVIHQELIKTQARIAELEAKNTYLETENAKLMQQPKPQAPAEISDDSLAILKLLSTLGYNYPTAYELSEKLGIGVERVNYFITELYDKDFIAVSTSPARVDAFLLAQKGRAALIKRGII